MMLNNIKNINKQIIIAPIARINPPKYPSNENLLRIFSIIPISPPMIRIGWRRYRGSPRIRSKTNAINSKDNRLIILIPHLKAANPH
jgi:hypothetical protein